MDALSSEITDDMFKSFYTIDRNLYSVLVFKLGHDPFESVQIMALWIWLERIGVRNAVQKILSFPMKLINGLAGDALTCLRCIKTPSLLLSPAQKNEILLTRCFLGKELSLQFFLENQVEVSRGIKEVVADVCIKALKDLMEAAIHRDTKPVEAPMMLIPRQEDRTMFATFSKGYPVAEWEVIGFFTKALGNCIESIHMQLVKPSEQPLYARVIFFDPAVIDFILKGEHKVKFTINGKHVWMRKFIPRITNETR